MEESQIRVEILTRRRNDKAYLQIWGGDVTGEFSVKSTYKCLVPCAIGVQSSIFYQLWQAKAFSNALVRILLDRIPIRTNLIKRGVIKVIKL